MMKLRLRRTHNLISAKQGVSDRTGIKIHIRRSKNFIFFPTLQATALKAVIFLPLLLPMEMTFWIFPQYKHNILGHIIYSKGLQIDALVTC